MSARRTPLRGTQVDTEEGNAPPSSLDLLPAPPASNGSSLAAAGGLDSEDDQLTQPSFSTLCFVHGCGSTFSSLDAFTIHLNSIHRDYMGTTDFKLLSTSLRAHHLTVCRDCRCAKLPGDSVRHVCLHKGRVHCPVSDCATTHSKLTSLKSHLRNQHPNVTFNAGVLKTVGLKQCATCKLCFALNSAKHICKGARPQSSSTSVFVVVVIVVVVIFIVVRSSCPPHSTGNPSCRARAVIILVDIWRARKCTWQVFMALCSFDSLRAGA